MLQYLLPIIDSSRTTGTLCGSANHKDPPGSTILCIHPPIYTIDWKELEISLRLVEKSSTDSHLIMG